jgi:cardiolipin synthase
MNVPNFLTILRILSIPVFVIFLLYDHFFVALLIFIGAGITDGLDGWIARVFNQRTTIGSYLDPIADKLILLTSFIVLAVLGIIPSWLTVIVIARDVIILLGVLILQLTSTILYGHEKHLSRYHLGDSRFDRSVRALVYIYRDKIL